MNVEISEQTARMAIAAMRERAENLRRAARSRANGGPAHVEYRAKLRQWAVDYDREAATLLARVSRKATR